MRARSALSFALELNEKRKKKSNRPFDYDMNLSFFHKTNLPVPYTCSASDSDVGNGNPVFGLVMLGELSFYVVVDVANFVADSFCFEVSLHCVNY